MSAVVVVAVLGASVPVATEFRASVPVATEVGDSVPVAVVSAPAGLAVTSAGCSGTESSMVGVACVVDVSGVVGLVGWPAKKIWIACKLVSMSVQIFHAATNAFCHVRSCS